jgi:hypothetical protein
MTPQQEKAKGLLTAFDGVGNGVWRHLHRHVVYGQLIERVDDPTKIDQGQLGLCAPSAFLEDLVTDDPVLYVRMAKELFDVGSTHMVKGPGRTGGRFIQTYPDLRSWPIPYDSSGTNRAEADWLMLSSIRMSSDWLKEANFFKAVFDPGYFGTKAQEIEEFFTDTGYSSVINATDKSGWQNLYTASMASALAADGYHVVLFINADLLDPGATLTGYSECNHVVNLLGPINGLGSNSVHCTFWTWARTLAVPVQRAPSPLLGASGNMTSDVFLSYYFGYIAAKY